MVAIPAGSALKEGQKVLASYIFPIESGKPMQMSVCLAEPKATWKYIEEQLKWMKDNVDPDMYFMGFDECASAAGTTPASRAARQPASSWPRPSPG